VRGGWTCRESGEREREGNVARQFYGGTVLQPRAFGRVRNSLLCLSFFLLPRSES
jgi:hypothetical protein